MSFYRAPNAPRGWGRGRAYGTRGTQQAAGLGDGVPLRMRAVVPLEPQTPGLPVRLAGVGGGALPFDALNPVPAVRLPPRAFRRDVMLPSGQVDLFPQGDASQKLAFTGADGERMVPSTWPSHAYVLQASAST